jgi:hydroxymethylbilane synthase
VTLRIGSRGSQLALVQANLVASVLRERTGADSSITVIRTSGDRLAEAPLSDIGGKRLFVKEIEDALLAGEVDLAVHSSKDMSATLPGGLSIGAVLPRADARDAIVLSTRLASPQPGPDGTVTVQALAPVLGPEPRIATSSVRRIAQLSRIWPRALFVPIRGNLDTRLAKLDAGAADALVLASAGLLRLGHEARISMALPPAACVPAPGQGIIAVQCRSDDTTARTLLSRIDDAAAATALDAERTVVVRLGGGCQMPLGAFAEVSESEVTLMAIVAAPDGSRVSWASGRAARHETELLGARVAGELLASGAGEILESVQLARAAAGGLQP